MTRRHYDPDWREIRDEIERTLIEAGFPGSTQVDAKITAIGWGLSHDNYGFRIDTGGAEEVLEQEAYVYRKLKADHPYDSQKEGIASVIREAQTLGILNDVKLPFFVPVFICLNLDSPPTGFIETWAPGLPLSETKGSPGHDDRILRLTAEIAAGVHQVPPDNLPDLRRWDSRRAHVLHEAGEFPQALLETYPVVRRAIEWVHDHLPPDEPTSLLHGDLLPQNIIWNFDDEDVTLIDWEYACIGDPAYDLAIATRGARKPFGRGDGLKLSVEAYQEAGGRQITTQEVMNHELLMVIGWLHETAQRYAAGNTEGHAPDYYEQQIESLLRRAAAAQSRS